MAYSIEFGLRPGVFFYVEILIVDINTGKLILPARGVDHRMNIVGHACDYGETIRSQQTIASNATGEITSPIPGVLCIAIPADRFAFCGPERGSARFELLAVPTADLALTCLLAEGTISFGGHMPNPRIQLNAYPLYPAGSLGSITLPAGAITPSAFLKAAEATIPGSVVDLVTNIPSDPTNEVAQEWRDGWFSPRGPIALLYQARNALTGSQVSAVFALGASYT